MKSILLSLMVTILGAASSAHAFGGYAAVAYSPSTGRVGQAYGATLYTAERAAINYCGLADCQIAAWAQNGCAAVAMGSYPEPYGYGVDYSRFAAEAAALSYCRLAWGSCELVASICTP